MLIEAGKAEVVIVKRCVSHFIGACGMESTKTRAFSKAHGQGLSRCIITFILEDCV